MNPQLEKQEPNNSWISSHRFLIYLFFIVAIAAAGSLFYYWQVGSQVVWQPILPQHKTVENIEIIVEINSRGGLCVSGAMCESKLKINTLGQVSVDNANTFNLAETELNNLVSQINSTNFSALMSKKFTGTCPTAFDGQEEIYTFYSSPSTYVIPSCEIDIDEESDLFELLKQIQMKARSL